MGRGAGGLKFGWCVEVSVALGLERRLAKSLPKVWLA